MALTKAIKTVEVATAGTWLCCLLLFLGFVFGKNAFAQAGCEKIVQAENWMAALSDTLPLTSLSIPGAHDAATCTIHGRGRCQALTIAELLHAGVRAFDLRPTLGSRFMRKAYQSPRLGNIHHGMKSTGLSLKEVFADFNAFLEEHPDEMLIVILRDESDGRYLFREPQKEKYAAALRDFLRTQKRLLDFSDTLRLGKARGSILVFSRNILPGSGIACVNWNHSIEGSLSRSIFYGAEQTARLFVQDCYAPKMIATNCSVEDFAQRKLCSAENFLDRTTVDKGTWVINHASAYVGRTNYCRNAELLNIPLARYIRGEEAHNCSGNRKPLGPTGILMMDFAGVDEARYRGKTYAVGGKALLDAVIENNKISGSLVVPSQ